MWQQNPSRRGRRIFEFGGEGMIRPEVLSPLSSTSESPIRLPFEPTIRTSFAEANHNTATPFPVLPFPLPLLPPNTSTNNQMDAMVWMWKTVCSVCQKICATPQELEHHLKLHLNITASMTPCSPAMLLQKNDWCLTEQLPNISKYEFFAPF